MLTFVLIPMTRKKLDAITFAGKLIDLPPADFRDVNPITLP